MKMLKMSKKNNSNELISINKSLKKYRNFRIINNPKMQNKMMKKYGGGKNIKSDVKYSFLLAKLKLYNKLKSIINSNSKNKEERDTIIGVLKLVKDIFNNINNISKIIKKNSNVIKKIDNILSSLEKNVHKIISKYEDDGSSIFDDNKELKKLNDIKRAVKKKSMYYEYNKIHNLIISYRANEYVINNIFHKLINNIKNILEIGFVRNREVSSQLIIYDKYFLETHYLKLYSKYIRRIIKNNNVVKYLDRIFGEYNYDDILNIKEFEKSIDKYKGNAIKLEEYGLKCNKYDNNFQKIVKNTEKEKIESIKSKIFTYKQQLNEYRFIGKNSDGKDINHSINRVESDYTKFDNSLEFEEYFDTHKIDVNDKTILESFHKNFELFSKHDNIVSGQNPDKSIQYLKSEKINTNSMTENNIYYTFFEGTVDDLNSKCAKICNPVNNKSNILFIYSRYDSNNYIIILRKFKNSIENYKIDQTNHTQLVCEFSERKNLKTESIFSNDYSYLPGECKYSRSFAYIIYKQSESNSPSRVNSSTSSVNKSKGSSDNHEGKMNILCVSNLSINFSNSRNYDYIGLYNFNYHNRIINNLYNTYNFISNENILNNTGYRIKLNLLAYYYNDGRYSVESYLNYIEYIKSKVIENIRSVNKRYHHKIIDYYINYYSIIGKYILKNYHSIDKLERLRKDSNNIRRTKISHTKNNFKRNKVGGGTLTKKNNSSILSIFDNIKTSKNKKIPLSKKNSTTLNNTRNAISKKVNKQIKSVKTDLNTIEEIQVSIYSLLKDISELSKKFDTSVQLKNVLTDYIKVGSKILSLKRSLNNEVSSVINNIILKNQQKILDTISVLMVRIPESNIKQDIEQLYKDATININKMKNRFNTNTKTKKVRTKLYGGASASSASSASSFSKSTPNKTYTNADTNADADAYTNNDHYNSNNNEHTNVDNKSVKKNINTLERGIVNKIVEKRLRIFYNIHTINKIKEIINFYNLYTIELEKTRNKKVLDKLIKIVLNNNYNSKAFNVFKRNYVNSMGLSENQNILLKTKNLIINQKNQNNIDYVRKMQDKTKERSIILQKKFQSLFFNKINKFTCNPISGYNNFKIYEKNLNKNDYRLCRNFTYYYIISQLPVFLDNILLKLSHDGSSYANKNKFLSLNVNDSLIKNKQLYEKRKNILKIFINNDEHSKFNKFKLDRKRSTTVIPKEINKSIVDGCPNLLNLMYRLLIIPEFDMRRIVSYCLFKIGQMYYLNSNNSSTNNLNIDSSKSKSKYEGHQCNGINLKSELSGLTEYEKKYFTHEDNIRDIMNSIFGKCTKNNTKESHIYHKSLNYILYIILFYLNSILKFDGNSQININENGKILNNNPISELLDNIKQDSNGNNQNINVIKNFILQLRITNLVICISEYKDVWNKFDGMYELDGKYGFDNGILSINKFLDIFIKK